MASFSHSITTISATANQRSSLLPHKKPLIHKTSQLSVCRIHPKLAIISCKAAKKDFETHIPNDAPNSITEKTSNIPTKSDLLFNNIISKFDRRNVLVGLGLGGATALATLGSVPALAHPMAQSDHSPVKMEVARSRKSRTKEEKQEEEEVLVVEVELSNTDAAAIKFDVYINDDHDHVSGEGTFINEKEYAGSFSAIPMNHQHNMVTSLLLPLNHLLEDLGADDDDILEVTLVPIIGQEAVTFRDVRIDYILDD